MPESDAPQPGSDQALRFGCICPVLDNARGRGVLALGSDYIIMAGCPLHAPPDPAPALPSAYQRGEEARS